MFFYNISLYLYISTQNVGSQHTQVIRHYHWTQGFATHQRWLNRRSGFYDSALPSSTFVFSFDLACAIPVLFDFLLWTLFVNIHTRRYFVSIGFHTFLLPFSLQCHLYIHTLLSSSKEIWPYTLRRTPQGFAISTTKVNGFLGIATIRQLIVCYLFIFLFGICFCIYFCGYFSPSFIFI